MGTSLVLEVQGVVTDPRDGVGVAASAIDSGKARALIDKLEAHFGTPA